MPKRIFHHFFSLRTPLRWLQNAWPILLLIAITAALAYLNYQPDTMITGWDNLHSEYNLPLNFKSAVFSVWQEKGPGFLAGMSFAADLPRIILLFLTSTVFNLNFVYARYFWTFLTLVVGPLGTYLLISHIFLKPKFDPETKRIASFLGALFYLLNLATVQYFFLPFEPFCAFFAFFPLIILATTLYFENSSLKNYLFLVVVFLFSSPSFFIQTLFVVTGLCLLPIVIQHFRHGKLQILILGLTLIATQSYWLLPQIFFVLTKAYQVGLSHANLISSPETLYRNLQFADLKNLTLLKGYWFNILDPGGDNKFDYLLLVWRNHLANPATSVIGYASFALVLTGIFFALRKKLPFAGSFLCILLICAFFLLGGVLLSGAAIPIITELLRSPFTKFSIPLAFAFSVFFSVGVVFLFDIFSFLHHRLTYLITLFTVSVALIIFTTPAFTGNLISPEMRLKLPADYLELFNFFQKEDPSTRIANFPQYVIWGWNYYNWGYRGAGFLWYGIPQPILDRGFDVWESSSERYYEEMSTALYSEDQTGFENALDKYDANWLVIDENIIDPSPTIDLGLTKLQKFIANSQKFTLARNINDRIFIYKVNTTNKPFNFLSLTPSSPRTDVPVYDLSLRPFAPEQLTNDQITLLATSQNRQAALLTVPSYSSSDTLIPVSVFYKKTTSGLELKLLPITPELSLAGQKITLTPQANLIDFAVPPTESSLIIGVNDQYYELQLPDELAVQNTFYPLTNLYLPPQKNINLSLYSNSNSYRLDLTSSLSQAEPYQCFTDKPDRKVEKIVDQQTISLYGTDMVACLTTPVPQPTDLNQLISLEFTYSSHTNTPANASVTDSTLGGAASPQPLLAKTDPTFTRIFTKARPIPLQANLILEANEQKTTQEIIYQNVQVSYLPLLGETNLTLNYIPGGTFPLPPETKITMTLPIVDSNLTVRSSVANNHFLPNAINCDNFNNGPFSRDQTQAGFLYTATNSNSCDQLNLKQLPHDINYAILGDVTNHLGLYPITCLENYATGRCDVYEKLIDGPQLIVQPIANSNESLGYTLHLFNQSFGSWKTQNLVKSLSVVPFPLNFIDRITYSPSTIPDRTAVSTISSTHPAAFIYLLHTTSGPTQTLNLYQTSSPYWKALEVSENDLKLPLWLLVAKLPHLYFFGTKTDLLIPNDLNWFNSWNLPAGAHTIVIFYLPQYLEFLGFLTLPLPFIGLLIYLIFRKSHKKSPR